MLSHFHVGCEGNLYDTRKDGWHKLRALRVNYSLQHRDIKTVADLKATLRAGQFAWPGGYQLYWITSDGAALSFDSVRAEFRQIAYAIKHNLRDGWRVVASAVNYEDTELTCEHSGKAIPASYV